MARFQVRTRWLGMKAGRAMLSVKRWTKRVIRPVRTRRRVSRFWQRR